MRPINRRDFVKRGALWVGLSALAPRIAQAAPIALIAHATAEGAATGPAVTGGVNTTGANFLFAASADYAPSFPGYTITDSKGNVWTQIRVDADPSVAIQLSCWYAKNAIVGTGHTLSIAGDYNSIYFVALSNVDTSSPLDQQANNGYNTGGSGTLTAQPGSITPSANNCVVLLAYAHNLPLVNPTIDSGMTFTDQDVFNGGNNEGGGAAYIVQTTAAAINPTITWTTLGPANVVISQFSFKPQPAGGTNSHTPSHGSTM